ncbi:hypothetical protein [Pseudomonas sp. YuFO8]|uniref:hypothetical protein n=1 Tax=Pseudomonas sp. YuFO8 TaxID=3095361 RepID=UPI002B241A0C|nr:hypothetical protein [Pseudomonas sp. YuFO8]MEB2622072.1 hypothetical protein [Pseudomonas sp. YuFO8]
MLDRERNELGNTGTTEFEWINLTKIERRLIRLYRLLNEKEQVHLRRMSEVLATHPEEPVES